MDQNLKHGININYVRCFVPAKENLVSICIDERKKRTLRKITSTTAVDCYFTLSFPFDPNPVQDPCVSSRPGYTQFGERVLWGGKPSVQVGMDRNCSGHCLLCTTH